MNTRSGLYTAEERDNCGFGLIAHIHGEKSNALVKQAIGALTCMTHRGGINADGKTGDGCGLLMQMPRAFVEKISTQCFDHALSAQYALGMVFLSAVDEKRNLMERELNEQLQAQQLVVIGWRDVPVDESCLGNIASSCQPRIRQVLIETEDDLPEADFQRRLFIAGRKAEATAYKNGDDEFFICSLSADMLAYKGLMMPAALARYYRDLSDNAMSTSICVFHQRFSTNTMPRWNLAQPFRYLAHNGEINTISGNRNNMKARMPDLANTVLGEHIEQMEPLVRDSFSDSASFDQTLELLIASGLDILVALRMMVPPAWEKNPFLTPSLKAFYQYNSLFMEPWDGPAGLVITDGRYAICALDRNGLRPARWTLCKDNIITLASETGVNQPSDPQQVVAKGRVAPGEIFVVDTQQEKAYTSQQIDTQLAHQKPYARWLQKTIQHIDNFVDEATDDWQDIRLPLWRKMFALSEEDCQYALRYLTQNGQEEIGAMGDDTPMAVLSQRGRVVSDYLRQQFAQITNPAIDPLRESIVMSLTTRLGSKEGIFSRQQPDAQRIQLDSPVITPAIFVALPKLSQAGISIATLDLQTNKEESLHHALERIQQKAQQEVAAGATVLVLSDRKIKQGSIPINSLLATGAVHHHLIRCQLRNRANIIVATGFARDAHQFATFIGCGANAVYPYLSYAYIAQLVADGILAFEYAQAYSRYAQGIDKGLMKILSKMGISCISSYRGAQLFEAIGLNAEVVNACFPGMVSRIGGSDFADIEKTQHMLAQQAWRNSVAPPYGGKHKYVHGGEYHAYNPDVVTRLRQAVSSGKQRDYALYADSVNQRPVTTLRDLLVVQSQKSPVALDDVEAVDSLFTRFDSAAMSLGALSPEAHETLAQAMNDLGARSNSGEGGEDPLRYKSARESKIKQVASGRFGVTASYLVNAQVLQIKIAQGAKPGEGGQLPGDKVSGLIAKLRYAVPGTTLISPPPHHDIYSIEDLAQLIFDLKQVNPQALVSVKLVSEPGIGTIAAGVVKAYADLITVSGYDGGTGASPLTSIHNAGSPWELGLMEVHQTLRANGLRHRVRIQADGGLKTGLDVVKAAILGAESFGFGTAPMIAMGCKYLRLCHLNNCATGVATQQQQLRSQHFVGSADMVKSYFRFVAEEIREILAALGYAKLEEIIGQTHLLREITGSTSQQKKLNLQPILHNGEYAESHICTAARNEPFDKAELGGRLLEDTRDAIASGSGFEGRYAIRNSDRSCGASVSGEIARRWGTQEMPEPIILRCTGVAGQSFGAWNTQGLHLHLHGEANDYVGKGMSGGKIVITPQQQDAQASWPIVGNTCLYGATGGSLFALGQAGERFAVRNSGALAVIEGAGDHCCEYMTGGVVIVLGTVGLNFGAGMSGGVAFVHATDKKRFRKSCNMDLIATHDLVADDQEADFFYDCLKEYAQEVGSQKALQLIDSFPSCCSQFMVVTGKGMKADMLLQTLQQKKNSIAASAV